MPAFVANRNGRRAGRHTRERKPGERGGRLANAAGRKEPGAAKPAPDADQPYCLMNLNQAPVAVARAVPRIARA